MSEQLTFMRKDDGTLHVYRADDVGEAPAEATYPLGAIHRLTEWLHEVPPKAAPGPQDDNRQPI